MISVIIPSRDEDLLGWTIANLRQSLKAHDQIEIIVVDDGSRHPVTEQEAPHCRILRNEAPRGNCPSRDWGIMEARYDLCLILDAHMTFPEPGWVDRAMAWHRPSVVACCGTNGVAHPQRGDAGRPEAVKSAYYGASLVPWSQGRMGDWRAYQGIWNRDPAIQSTCDAGQRQAIGCLMGGAYFLSKRHYLDTLRSPWAYLRGWGSSEPVISIAHRRTGGTVELWPLWFGHHFRAAAPYSTPLPFVWHNMMVAAALAGHDCYDRLLDANPKSMPNITQARAIYLQRAEAYVRAFEHLATEALPESPPWAVSVVPQAQPTTPVHGAVSAVGCAQPTGQESVGSVRERDR